MLHLIFYLFAAVAVGSAVNVIVATNPVRSVLSLVVTFFAMAGIWMIMHAEFLSIILVLVYVGAVMTLFLFVVMMLNIRTETRKGGFVSYLPFGILVAAAITVMMFIVISSDSFDMSHFPNPLSAGPDYSNLTQLGTELYTTYVYPFEIAGVLLLAAMIAAIALAYRGPTKRKIQNPERQVDVDPKTRVKLVNLASSPREEGAR